MKVVARLRGTRVPLRLVLARLQAADYAASSWRQRRLSLHWRRARRARAPLPGAASAGVPANIARTFAIVARQPLLAPRRDVFMATHLHAEHRHSHVAVHGEAPAARLARAAGASSAAPVGVASGQAARGAVQARGGVLTTRPVRVGQLRRAPGGWPRHARPSLELPDRAGASAPVASAAGRHVFSRRAPIETDDAVAPSARFERLRPGPVPLPAQSDDGRVHAVQAGRRPQIATTVAGENRNPPAAQRPQLVWRERRPAALAAADAAASAAAGDQAPASAPVAAPPRGDQVGRPVADLRSPMRRSPPVSTEESMVERLTQEVIQRIERRMRIERERRGL